MSKSFEGLLEIKKGEDYINFLKEYIGDPIKMLNLAREYVLDSTFGKANEEKKLQNLEIEMLIKEDFANITKFIKEDLFENSKKLFHCLSLEEQKKYVELMHNFIEYCNKTKEDIEKNEINTENRNKIIRTILETYFDMKSKLIDITNDDDNFEDVFVEITQDTSLS